MKYSFFPFVFLKIVKFSQKYRGTFKMILKWIRLVIIFGEKKSHFQQGLNIGI